MPHSAAWACGFSAEVFTGCHDWLPSAITADSMAHSGWPEFDKALAAARFGVNVARANVSRYDPANFWEQQ